MEGKVALLNPRRTEAAPLALDKDKEVMKELEGKRGEDGHQIKVKIWFLWAV